MWILLFSEFPNRISKILNQVSSVKFELILKNLLSLLNWEQQKIIPNSVQDSDSAKVGKKK